MNNFGEKLRKLRKEKGLTIRKLSELSGVAHSFLSQVETGKRGIPKADTLKKIAIGLDVPFVDLLVKAGYIKKTGYLSPEHFDIEEKELTKEKPIVLDDLLNADYQILFQNKLLTIEEKAKIKSVIELLLKD